MKKILKALRLINVFLFAILTFIACDKDFNTIGSDIIGEKNFETKSAIFSVTAYNKKLDPVQTNRLPSNLLGVFNDPVYGQTTASIISQIIPSTFNPDFGENPVIDSVILSIPYFSKISPDSPDEDGNIIYSISESDSLYGSSPIKLSIYQNNYFLRDFDPETEFNDPQDYYSNSNSSINFDNHIGDLIFGEDEFVPSEKPVVLKTFNEETQEFVESERLAPRFRVALDNLFWTNTIIDKVGGVELSNNNNFKDYFRGLYFKAEAINGEGHMILLNLASTDANITIFYSRDSDIEDDPRVQSTFVLNFTENRLNVFDNNFSFTLTDGDEIAGDEKLYLKGGEGSMAIVDLFGNPGELENFQNQRENWLINQANLVFYEDENIASPTEDYHNYDRIYLYDLKNNTPLVDYLFDQTQNDAFPINSRVFHLGQRVTDENGMSRYKIRITEHINSILLRDSTNTKLGVVLSTNVNTTQNSKILGADENMVNSVPVGSVLSPRGTILYGSNINLPEEKRVQLEIFYTEPNN